MPAVRRPRPVTIRAVERREEEAGNRTQHGSRLTCDNLDYVHPALRSTLDAPVGPQSQGHLWRKGAPR